MLKEFKKRKLEEFVSKINNVYATVFALSTYNKKQLTEKENIMKDFISNLVDEVEEAISLEDIINEAELTAKKEDEPMYKLIVSGFKSCRDKIINNLNK